MFKGTDPVSVCTVQVIVMSGHETIRVLEVEVDASLPSSAPDDKGESKAAGEVAQAAAQPEVAGTQDILTVPQSAVTACKCKHDWIVLVERQVQHFRHIEPWLCSCSGC